MNFKFSFSRLLSAGLLVSLVTMMIVGCNKNDKQTPPPTVPVVTTAALTNVSYNAATGGGSIVSDGGATITASGVVWSKTNATPTLSDSVVAGTTATGTFTSDLTGLEENTSYYIRAFATNSVGTGYGNVVTLNTTNDTNKVRFTYKGEEVVYGIIVSPGTGKKWLDRNLGAKQVATAWDDYNAYGDMFQWGRNDDGHQLINWTSSSEGAPVNGYSTVVATSDTPGHNNFIIPPYDYPLDWRSENSANRWSTTPRGPCPEGWHVPSLEEWSAERTAEGGITDRATGYSKLKLTAGSGKRGVDGPGVVIFQQTGSVGYYWSSSDMLNVVDGNSYQSFLLALGIDGANVGDQKEWKSTAMPVRCIHD